GDRLTVDLNTLNDTVNHGVYYQSLDSGATTALNYPTQQAGTLLVTGSAYGAQQEYTTYASSRKFVRGKTQANTWYPWKEIGGPKHHYSGHNMLCTSPTIPANGNARVYPQALTSSLGISLDGNRDYVVSKSGKYKIDWGFSIEPTGAIQQGVGAIWKNGAVYITALVYNYCPASTSALQMGISSASVIIDLVAGDKISLVVQAVNNTTVKIYQSGSIVVQEL
ncbi:MAG: pyocin knob domain-containing protein, partial [Fusobacteriaceae bacterium]